MRWHFAARVRIDHERGNGLVRMHDRDGRGRQETVLQAVLGSVDFLVGGDVLGQLGSDQPGLGLSGRKETGGLFESRRPPA